MAYMSQEKKAKLAPSIKRVLAKYNLKGSLAISGHSSLVLNIKSGPLDFLGNWFETFSDPMRPMADWQRADVLRAGKPKYLQVNTYHIDSHYTGIVREALLELRDAMMVGNHDRSDIMSDYFDVGWYVNINVGKWDKPYQITQ